MGFPVPQNWEILPGKDTDHYWFDNNEKISKTPRQRPEKQREVTNLAKGGNLIASLS